AEEREHAPAEAPRRAAAVDAAEERLPGQRLRAAAGAVGAELLGLRVAALRRHQATLERHDRRALLAGQHGTLRVAGAGPVGLLRQGRVATVPHDSGYERE